MNLHSGKFLFFIVSILLLGTSFLGYSQVVNAYAKVTNITGTTLSLSNVDQTNHSFIVGEYVVVIQMQDDVIGSNTNNDAAFGDVASIGSVGLYEIKQIVAINGDATLGFSSATPTSIDLIALNNTYNTGSNASLQIVTFRQLSAGNYSTTSNITAIDWDGNVGGVVAIYVPGVLTLNHSITANAAGFRGGSVSTNHGGSQCIAANVTRYRENNNQLGFKGEGIYKSTDPLHNNGRAKIGNGGGGGSHHNAGGGGGGNFTAGGLGGNGYNNCTTNPAGGLGGLDLSAYIDGTRVFMGGGGGGGQQNNSQGRNGGDGGGIIFIKASEITTGTCGSINISANGTGPTTNGTNDGGGGGGAGGSMVFWVDTWNIAPTCTINFSSNGGNGSTSNNGAAHAGGGGGAQGTIIFNGATPSSNATVATNNGTPGCNNNSSPCTNSAGQPTGTNNSGVIPNMLNPLPIELVEFLVEPYFENSAIIKWFTASESNNSHFIIEKSIDGVQWFEIAQIKGAGNSSASLSYSFIDYSLVNGYNYYRLKQVDYDGKFSISKPKSILHESLNEAIIFHPNPFNNEITLLNNLTIENVLLYSIDGKLILNSQFSSSTIDLGFLEPGVYLIGVNTEKGYFFTKIVKE